MIREEWEFVGLVAFFLIIMTLAWGELTHRF
jgi:cytochrome b